MLLGFLIWLCLGLMFMGTGAYMFLSGKSVPFGFWANVEIFQVRDVRGYNRAVGKLWFTFGLVFILLGLPFLSGQNSALSVLSILGVMAEAIGAMVVYTVVIERKYRRKQGE